MVDHVILALYHQDMWTTGRRRDTISVQTNLKVIGDAMIMIM